MSESEPKPLFIPGWGQFVKYTYHSPSFESFNLADKLAKARDMERSLAPEWYREYTAMMTWLDDVQDFVLTLGVLGRTILRPTFPLLIPWLKPLFVLADLLEALTAICRLPLGGHMAKLLGQGLRGFNPWLRLSKAAMNARLNRVMPTLGELFQVAQTTANLFGVGLQIGPAYGFISDIYFGLRATAGGGRVKVIPPSSWRTPQEEKDYPARPWKWKGLTDAQIKALRAARACTALMQQNDVWTIEEHAILVMILAEAYRDIADAMIGVPIDEVLEPIIDLELPWNEPVAEISVTAAANVPADAHIPPRWPIPGTPLRVTPRHLAMSMAANAWAAEQSILARREPSAALMFHHINVSEAADQMVRVVHGNFDAYKVRHVPWLQGLIYMINQGIYPPAWSLGAQGESFLYWLRTYQLSNYGEDPSRKDAYEQALDMWDYVQLDRVTPVPFLRAEESRKIQLSAGDIEVPFHRGR